MKVGGGSQQQQTKNDPWDGLKPYLIGLDGKTGIMPEAERLYKESSPQYYQGNTYAGLNGTQQNAMDSLADYYKSPESMTGANAASNYGNSLLSKPDTFGGVSVGSPLALDAYSKISAPSTSNAQTVNSANIGTSGVDWKTPLSQTLQGKIDNQYLSQIADTIGRSAADNYNRNIAPSIRSGAQLSGQFGGSRQGVVEANALKDINQSVADNVSNLYGNAYNQAQQAKNSSAMQLAGQESGERISQAQLAQQASLAQAQLAQQKAMQDAQLQYQAQRDNQQAGLQQGGLALQYGNLALQDKLGTANLNLNADNQTFGQKLAGISLLNQASQQPLQNYQGLLGIGNLQQQDQQNQINADVARWNYNQTLPWQNLQNYMGMVTGAGGRYGEGSMGQSGFNWGLDFTQSGGGGGGGGASDMAKAAVILSDRRTKRNIVKIGSRPDGLNVYAYNYLWSNDPQIGVMADEVKQIKPHAVITLDNGLMAVNYGAL